MDQVLVCFITQSYKHSSSVQMGGQEKAEEKWKHNVRAKLILGSVLV